MKTGKRKLTIVLATCGLLAAVGIGSSVAYLTDVDNTQNNFTVGKIDIELTEPSYAAYQPTDEDGSKLDYELVPNEEIHKDPTITNIGDNDVVIFVSFDIPIRKVVVANEDGTVSNLKGNYYELFNFRSAASGTYAEGKLSSYPDGAAANGYQNSVNDGWVLIEKTIHKDYKAGEMIPTYTRYVLGYNRVVTGTAWATPSDAVIASSDTITYGEGYQVANEAVTAPPVFDYVRLLNVVEGQLDDEKLDIPVRAYAIQADWLQKADTGRPFALDKNAEISWSDLSKIYSLFADQRKIERLNTDTGSDIATDSNASADSNSD
jgi:predicted ribosomally synthesized peptide with SipW-like signal peptide